MDKKTFYAEYFDRHRGKHGPVSEKDKLIVRYLRKNKRKVQNLLDIGCLSSDLHRLIRQNIDVENYYGIDLLPAAECGLENESVIYSQRDIDQGIPSSDVKYDVIVCSEVIEHLVCPDNVFSFVRSNLANSGVLIVTTPNLAVWFNRIIFLFGCQPAFTEVSARYNIGKLWSNVERQVSEGRQTVGGHLRMFTMGALVQLGQCYGLRPKLKASTGGGPGVLGVVTTLLSAFPSLGNNLFCVFERQGLQ